MSANGNKVAGNSSREEVQRQVRSPIQFYFTTNGDYKQMKAYIRMLDYLRLLILEYQRSAQSATAKRSHKSLQQESGQVE